MVNVSAKDAAIPKLGLLNRHTNMCAADTTVEGCVVCVVCAHYRRHSECRQRLKAWHMMTAKERGLGTAQGVREQDDGCFLWGYRHGL
jgi:hypothetical protein